MADKIPVVSEKIYKFDGVYNIKDTYTFILDYVENSMYYDITEKEYEEKNNPPSYKIVSKLVFEKPLNDDYGIFIKCTLDLSGKDVEVEINGVKKIMNQGTGKITLNSYIEPKSDVDPEKSPFGHFLNRIYEKFFGPDEKEKAMVQSAIDVGEIIDRFKQYMNSITK